jgi:alpha-amylase
MKRLGIMTAALMALSVLFFACDTGGDEDSSIKVTSVTISGVGVANSAASIAIDGALTLTATVKPDNATDKNVTWSSSDETKATVTAEGVVTGVAAGEATVTAAANGGGGSPILLL